MYVSPTWSERSSRSSPSVVGKLPLRYVPVRARYSRYGMPSSSDMSVPEIARSSRSSFFTNCISYSSFGSVPLSRIFSTSNSGMATSRRP